MAVARDGAIFLVMMVIAACGTTGGTPSAAGPTTRPTEASSAQSTPRPSPALPAGVAQVIDVDEPVWGVSAAEGTIWVEGDELHQLDATTGEILQSLPGYWPTVAGETLWYLRGDQLISADASTGRELAAYTPSVLGTTVHEGVLWADDEAAGKLFAIDLATNAVLHEVDMPTGEAKWVAVWEGAVWVVIDGSDVVVRIDHQTGEILSTKPAGSRPHSVVTAFGSLWVTDHGVAQVQRFRANGDAEATITGPGINVAITATELSIWSAAPQGVMEIDPRSNEVVREVHLGSGDWYGMAYSEGFVWLTSADGGRLYQIPVR
jgi:hypothetical protein